MHHMLTSLYANISKPDIEPAELDNECCIPSQSISKSQTILLHLTTLPFSFPFSFPLPYSWTKALFFEGLKVTFKIYTHPPTKWWSTSNVRQQTDQNQATTSAHISATTFEYSIDVEWLYLPFHSVPRIGLNQRSTRNR
jgi:hypothetical protein